MSAPAGLILASASPRRRELLRRLDVEFTVEAADVEEISGGDDPFALPEKNALRKASAVAAAHPAHWVLGADTVIVFRGRVIGKPADLTEAAGFLREFSGETHRVVTGMALVCRRSGVCEVWREESQVRFRKLSEETIRRYLAEVHVLDKAGAYAIQEKGDRIVESFSGEVENIVGLPLKKLETLLKKYAIGGKFSHGKGNDR